MSFFLIRPKKLEHVFMLDDITIHIQQKPIKSIRLKINKHDGSVSVSAPIHLRLSFIQQQIELKRSWIYTQRANLQKNKSSSTMREGEWHAFQGQTYQLTTHDTNTKPYIVLHEQRMQLFIHPEATNQEKERVLEQWYRTQMAILLDELIEKWQTIIGVTVTSYQLKWMRSRWGSCHPTTKRISMNLHLIKKPHDCLEYVLVHEMIHILEPSHNKRFYALMQQFLPNWQTYKRLLAGGIE